MRIHILLLALLIPSLAIKLKVRDPACTSSNRCAKCEGSCTQESDCEAGLKCFQRTLSTELVPGCEPGGDGDVSVLQYCYKPCPAGTEPTAGCTGLLSSVLANGSPSCGITDGSLEIWVNTAIASNELYDVTSTDFNIAGSLRTNKLKVDNSIKFSHGVNGAEFGIGANGDDVIKIWKSGNTKNYMDISADISEFAVRAPLTDFLQEVQHRKQVDFLKSAVFGTCFNYGGPSRWRDSRFDVWNAPFEKVVCHSPATMTSYPFIFNYNTMFTDHVNMQSLRVVRGLTSQKKVTLNNACYVSAYYDANPDQCKTTIYGNLIASGRANYFDLCGKTRGCSEATKRTTTFGGGSHGSWHYPFKVNEQAYFTYHSHFASTVNVGGVLSLSQPYGITYSISSGKNTNSLGINFFRDANRDFMDITGFQYVRAGAAAIQGSDMWLTSDRRIKNNIVEIPDALALETFRGLEAKYYNYKGNDKSDGRQIGFIAQEVREAIPEAVTLDKGTVPDEQRVVEVLWQEVVNSTEYSMELSLETLAPGKYKFKFSEDGSSAELETLDGKTFLTGDGKVWTSKTKHSEVELYGSIVDDFHYINKDKIFTVAYAALQEVDRTQQALLLTIASLEARLAALEA